MTIDPNSSITIAAAEIVETAIEKFPKPNKYEDARKSRCVIILIAEIRRLVSRVKNNENIKFSHLCALRTRLGKSLSGHYIDEPLSRASEIMSRTQEAVEKTMPQVEQIESGPRVTQNIVAKSPAMKNILRLVEIVSKKRFSVLILGETGVGKELIARALHSNGQNGTSGFLAINCAAIPENLLEAELFGHSKGAFTDAHKDRNGLLSTVGSGTLFLDEIGEMPLSLQAKLLRVLEDHKFRKVGDTHEYDFRGRVVAATNRPREQLKNGAEFRKDLYHRLAEFVIEIPPLRERPEDLDALITTILLSMNPQVSITDAARQKIKLNRLEGNVRELQTILRTALIHANVDDKEIIDESNQIIVDLDPTVQIPRELKDFIDTSLTSGKGLRQLLHEIEAQCLAAALEQTGRNVTEAAVILKINRTTLQEKMARLGLCRNGK